MVNKTEAEIALIEKDLKDKLELYLSDYSFDVKVKREKDYDLESIYCFQATLKYDFYSHPKTYDVLCRWDEHDEFEFELYEDNWETLTNANMWKWLYITECSRRGNPDVNLERLYK